MPTNNGTPESATDVRDYLDRFGGKEPSELLGLPDQKGLGGAMVLATVISTVIFVALTFIPYLLGLGGSTTAKVEPPAAKNEPAKPETPKQAPATKAVAEKDKPAEKGKGKAKAEAKAKAGEQPPSKGAPDILQKMGEADVKTASPKVNPLDQKTDDLLKDLK